MSDFVFGLISYATVGLAGFVFGGFVQGRLRRAQRPPEPPKPELLVRRIWYHLTPAQVTNARDLWLQAMFRAGSASLGGEVHVNCGPVEDLSRPPSERAWWWFEVKAENVLAVNRMLSLLAQIVARDDREMTAWLQKIEIQFDSRKAPADAEREAP